MTHCEVCRVGEEDRPAILDPLMPVHVALSGFRFKVRDNVTQAQYLRSIRAYQAEGILLNSTRHSSISVA